MAQPIPAVKTSTPPHGAVSGAADAALILIQAGGNPDGELMRLLTDLKEAAAHNAEVYSQAAAEVSKATALQADIAKERAAVDARLADAAKMEQDNTTAKIDGERALARDRRALDDERQTFEVEARRQRAAADARDEEGKARLSAAEAQERANSAESAKLNAQEASIADREAALKVLLGDLSGFLARVAEIERA